MSDYRWPISFCMFSCESCQCHTYEPWNYRHGLLCKGITFYTELPIMPCLKLFSYFFTNRFLYIRSIPNLSSGIVSLYCHSIILMSIETLFIKIYLKSIPFFFLPQTFLDSCGYNFHCWGHYFVPQLTHKLFNIFKFYSI